MEQEEYTKEEIDWSYIEFVDNQDILDLIEKVNEHMNCFSHPTIFPYFLLFHEPNDFSLFLCLFRECTGEVLLLKL